MVVICCNTVSWHMVKLSNQWLNNLFDSNLCSIETLWLHCDLIVPFIVSCFIPCFCLKPLDLWNILKRGLFKTIVLLNGWDNKFHVYSGLLNSYHWGFTLKNPHGDLPTITSVTGPSTTSATWSDEASHFGNGIQSWLCTSCTEKYSNIQWNILKYTEICIFMDPSWELNHQMWGTSQVRIPSPARRRCRSGRSQQLGKLCATWARQGSCSCQAGRWSRWNWSRFHTW